MCIGVGDLGGREQLAQVKGFLEEHRPGPDDIVLIACDRGSGGVGRAGEFQGSPVFSVPCAGSLHTSVIERFVNADVGGVMVCTDNWCGPYGDW